MKFKHPLIAAAVLVSACAHAETNPFTGANVETERVKAERDLQHERNNLAKEVLEAKRIEFQTKNSEKVMEADLRKLLTPSGVGGMASMPPGFPSEKALPKPVEKAAKKPVAAPAVAAVPPATDMPVLRPPVVSWAPKLVAVMESGQGRIAVIESGGVATTVAVGDHMGIGKVTEIDGDSVTVGGRTLFIDKSVIAMNNPDKQDVPGGAAGGAGMPAMGGMPAPSGGFGVPGAAAGGAPGIVPPGFGGMH